MSDRKCAGNEGRIHRVKLALYPVGPDPVQVVLDNTAVDQPPSVEHHAGSKQLDGLTDFRWLGKTVQLTEQRDRIQKTMTMGHTLNHITPGQPVHPAHSFASCSFGSVSTL